MAAVARLSSGLLAHGGLAGAVSEIVVAATVAAGLVALWWRERRRRTSRGRSDASARDD